LQSVYKRRNIRAALLWVCLNLFNT
jgi:hypothetical protein